MAQTAQHFCFSLELPLRALGKIGILLDGTHPIKINIPGTINRAKPSLTDLFHNAIAVIQNMTLSEHNAVSNV
jgi:hypothetical protein